MRDPLQSILADMVRATPINTVTAKTFKLGTQDFEWLMTDCQPGGFTVGCRAGELPSYKASFVALTPTEGTTGDTQEVVTGEMIDNWCDFGVTVDTRAFDWESWELALETNPILVASGDEAGSGTARLPYCIRLGAQRARFTLESKKKIAVGYSSVLADDIDTGIDIVVTGSGAIYTLSGMNTPQEEGPLQNDSGIVVYRYTFTDNKWAALAITTPA
jgi:hypothetical protein